MQDHCYTDTVSYAWIDPRGRVHKLGGSGHHQTWARRYIARTPALQKRYPEVSLIDDVGADDGGHGTYALVSEGWIRVVNARAIEIIKPTRQAWRAYIDIVLACLVDDIEGRWLFKDLLEYRVYVHDAASGSTSHPGIELLLKRYAPALEGEFYERLLEVSERRELRRELELERARRREPNPARVAARYAGSSLYHTTSWKGLEAILRQGKVQSQADYVSFSEKPLWGGDIQASDVVLSLSPSKLRSQLMKVEYNERWAERYPMHASYVAGEGWAEQFQYSEDCIDEDGWEDDDCMEQEYNEAMVQSFLWKRDEQEWLSKNEGQAVRVGPSDVKGVVVSSGADETLAREILDAAGYVDVPVRRR